MLSRILIGFLISALGFLMVYKTPWFLSILGRVRFAEKTFGGGGTRIFYKLLGTVVLLVGFMVMLNLWEGFFVSVFGKAFGL